MDFATGISVVQRAGGIGECVYVCLSVNSNINTTKHTRTTNNANDANNEHIHRLRPHDDNDEIFAAVFAVDRLDHVVAR